MRTTVTLDDDAAAIARVRARDTGISLGKAISMLIREGVMSHRDPVEYPGEFRPLPERPGEPLVTLEFVNQLRDELP